MPYWTGLDASAIRSSLGLASTAEDGLLQTLADSAATGIETWLNRTIQSASYSLAVDGNNRSVLLWPDFPVTAVSAVSISGIAVPAAAAGDFTGLGYRFDATRLILQGGQVFTPGMLNVSIAYTAGYATVPADLLQAAVESAALKYRQRQSIGINSKTLAGETVSFVQADFPQSALKIMKNYARVVPAN